MHLAKFNFIDARPFVNVLYKAHNCQTIKLETFLQA